jgi:hypothetical protein
VKVECADARDVAELERLHGRQREPYPFPGRSIADAVVVRDGGAVVAGAVTVRAVEVVLVLDHRWGTPARRWAAVAAMQEQLADMARQAGVDCAYVWLEPRRARGFGRKLMERLGWSRPVWDCYQRKV